MKKLIKIRVRKEEVQEVEVDFPIYREHDCGGDSYSLVHYMRVEHDGTLFDIKRSAGHGTEGWELEISKTYFNGRGDADYELGRGEHQLSAEDWGKMLAKAKAFLARFPESSASSINGPL